jgi:hypothetical protein
MFYKYIGVRMFTIVYYTQKGIAKYFVELLIVKYECSVEV